MTNDDMDAFEDGDPEDGDPGDVRDDSPASMRAGAGLSPVARGLLVALPVLALIGGYVVHATLALADGSDMRVVPGSAVANRDIGIERDMSPAQVEARHQANRNRTDQAMTGGTSSVPTPVPGPVVVVDTLTWRAPGGDAPMDRFRASACPADMSRLPASIRGGPGVVGDCR